jgi:outer membrane protein
LRAWYILLTACTLNGESTLLTLIDSAQQNERIESLMHQNRAAQLGFESAKHSYFPRVDAFGSAAYVDRTGGFDAKQSYSAGVKGEWVVFDGFKRENIISQNSALVNASKHRLSDAKKEIALEVVERYLQFQNTLDEIRTLKIMRDQLQAQYQRLEKFKTAGLASEDSLMRIRAELSDAEYKIENLSYRSDQEKSSLEILTAQKMENVQDFHILPPDALQFQEHDKIHALRFARDAKMYEAQTKDATDLPTFKLEDQLSFNDYVNDPIASMRVDRQNKLIATMSINLIDFSAASLAKQALVAQAQAQSSELSYALKENDHNRRLALRYIEKTRALIEASTRRSDASLKTFEAVKQKYESRIVDYVTYLDALHQMHDAINQVNRSQRTLYYAYALYYYHAGFDPKEFIQ